MPSRRWIPHGEYVTVTPRWVTMACYAASNVLGTAALATQLPVPAAGLWARERAVRRLTARLAHGGCAGVVRTCEERC